jgi:hypothetical protein
MDVTVTAYLIGTLEPVFRYLKRESSKTPGINGLGYLSAGNTAILGAWHFRTPGECGPCQHIAVADRIAPNRHDQARVSGIRVGDR